MGQKSKFRFGLLILVFSLSVGVVVASSPGDGSPPRLITSVNLKVMLAGPYDSGTGLMKTDLNPTWLPLTQPYGGSEFVGTPMFDSGGEFVGGWTGVFADAVDWVLVEVRGTGEVTADTVQAGVLLKDGSIVNPTDGGQLKFAGFLEGAYKVIVRHRNHLPIMSSSDVTFVNVEPAPLYDMTLEANILAGSAGAQDLGAGVFGLYAGNANLDNKVNYFNPFTGDDRTAVLIALGGSVIAEVTGYYVEDVQLDGKVNYFNPFTGDDRTVVLVTLGGSVIAEVTSAVPD